jgi:hypothetical protein
VSSRLRDRHPFRAGRLSLTLDARIPIISGHFSKLDPVTDHPSQAEIAKIETPRSVARWALKFDAITFAGKMSCGWHFCTAHLGMHDPVGVKRIGALANILRPHCLNVSVCGAMLSRVARHGSPSLWLFLTFDNFGLTFNAIRQVEEWARLGPRPRGVPLGRLPSRVEQGCVCRSTCAKPHAVRTVALDAEVRNGQTLL